MLRTASGGSDVKILETMKTANIEAQGKTVFLVDDNSSSLDLYSSRLQQAGFRTASAFGAEEALQALPNLSADLIIVDLMLPKRRGLELLQAIRSDSRHKNTPVLVLSNAYLPEMVQRALRAGGSRELPRSKCTPSKLISISRELVGIHEGADAERGGAIASDSATQMPAEGAASSLGRASRVMGRAPGVHRAE